MKYKAFLLIFILLISITPSYGAKYPKRFKKNINDYGNVLNESDEKIITQTIKYLKEKKDVEMTLLTINSIKDYEESGNIDKLGKELFDNWQVGGPGKSKGILVLFALEDRQIRIETGPYYENTLDKDMQNIIDRHINSYFTKELYSAGLKSTASSISDCILSKNIEWNNMMYTKDGFLKKYGWTLIIGVLIIVYGLALLSYNKDGDRGWGHSLISLTLTAGGNFNCYPFSQQKKQIRPVL